MAGSSSAILYFCLVPPLFAKLQCMHLTSNWMYLSVGAGPNERITRDFLEHWRLQYALGEMSASTCMTAFFRCF